MSTEQGFPYWLAHGMVLWGRALTEQGQGEQGVAQIQRGLNSFQTMGIELNRIEGLPWLAIAFGSMGRAEEGRTVLTEVLGLVSETGVCAFEAELYRLKGELTLQQESKEQRARSTEQKSENLVPSAQRLEPHGEAEACLLKAIAIAQHQQAKSWELRASTSLARLWQSQGKRKEAHKLLSDIYGWFTEGFDTKDLQEAKTLLEELA